MNKEEHNAYHREYKRKRYRQRRALAIKKLGGKCAVCGTTKNLELDHIDPKSKEFEVMTKGFHFSEKRFLAELTKCQLLCKKDHSAKTVVDCGNSPATHGSLSMYTHHKCRCAECSKAHSDYRKKWQKRKGITPKARKKAKHGSSSMYGYHGCRCEKCKEGQRIRCREYQRKKRAEVV